LTHREAPHREWILHGVEPVGERAVSGREDDIRRDRRAGALAAERIDAAALSDDADLGVGVADEPAELIAGAVEVCLGILGAGTSERDSDERGDDGTTHEHGVAPVRRAGGRRLRLAQPMPPIGRDASVVPRA
jgi:hypothetical protein